VEMIYRLVVDTKDPSKVALEWFWKDIPSLLPVGASVDIYHCESNLDFEKDAFVVRNIEYCVSENVCYIWAKASTPFRQGEADDAEPLFKILGFARGDDGLWDRDGVKSQRFDHTDS